MNDIQHYNRLIQPVNDETLVNRLLTILVELSPEDQYPFWFRDAEAGSVCLYANEQVAPGMVLEYVQGSQGDSITTLYRATELFTSRRRLIDARRAMALEIAAALLSLPSAVTFFDHGREREVSMPEMGTAQLIDQWARARSVSLEAIA